MTDTPLVSVLMTAYNREAYLGEAMASVVASDFDNWELIIVDDGSTDRTSEIAREWAAREPRIRFFQNPKNLGDYPNRNKAASYARGRFLKYLDSDDLIYPHGLRVMLEMIQQYPEAALGISDVADPDYPHPILLGPVAVYEQHFFKTGILGRAPGSTIIRRDAFEAIDGFSGVRQVGDHECWLKIAAEYPVLALPPNLFWARTHQCQEQAVDSSKTKSLLHYQVMLEALNRSRCPFDRPTNIAALKHIKAQQIRAGLSDLRHLRFSDYSERKRIVEFSFSDTLGALVSFFFRKK